MSETINAVCRVCGNEFHCTEDNTYEVCSEECEAKFDAWLGLGPEVDEFEPEDQGSVDGYYTSDFVDLHDEEELQAEFERLPSLPF
jgi:hypothetical protein